MDTPTIFSLLTVFVFLAVAILHEVLHIYCAQKLGYTTSISVRYFKKVLPYALAVDLEKNGRVLKGKWRSWDTETKSEYNTIAMFPYIFILPFSVFLLLTQHPILMFWSTGITAWHFFNYPLEWLVK